MATAMMIAVPVPAARSTQSSGFCGSTRMTN
jgi:hypothetical protein